MVFKNNIVGIFFFFFLMHFCGFLQATCLSSGLQKCGAGQKRPGATTAPLLPGARARSQAQACSCHPMGAEPLSLVPLCRGSRGRRRFLAAFIAPRCQRNPAFVRGIQAAAQRRAWRWRGPAAGAC